MTACAATSLGAPGIETHTLKALNQAGEAISRHCVFYGVKSLIGVMDWSHGVEYWSRFLEWNFGVKCCRERETFILVVKSVSFERTCNICITHISNGN